MAEIVAAALTALSAVLAHLDDEREQPNGTASLASAAPVVEARALQEPRRANPLHAPAIPPARCLALRSICKAKLLGLT